MSEKPFILRTSPWMPICGWIILAILIIEPMVRGYWSVVIAFGPGVLLIAWLLYVVFWAPCIEVTRHEVIVHNVFRSTFLPFPLITDISVGALVKITFEHEHKTVTLTSWNAPGRTRPKMTAFAPKDPASQIGPQIGPSEILVNLWLTRMDEDQVGDVRINTHWASLGITVALTAVLTIATMLGNSPGS